MKSFLIIFAAMAFSINSYSATEKYLITKTVDTYVQGADSDIGPDAEFKLHTSDSKRFAFINCDIYEMYKEMRFFDHGKRYSFEFYETKTCRSWVSYFKKLSSANALMCLTVEAKEDGSYNMDAIEVDSSTDCQ